jgi:hypothetical protein
LTTEPDEKDKTAPIELPHPSGPLAPGGFPSQGSSVESGDSFRPLQPGEADSAAFGERPREALETPTDSTAGTEAAARPSLIPRAVSAGQQDVMFVPLAVSIGDGFKFGCGFFLAGVLALLVGFVLIALLFVVTSLFGLNLPISR